MSCFFLPAKVLSSLSSANSDSGIREWRGTPKFLATPCRSGLADLCYPVECPFTAAKTG